MALTKCIECDKEISTDAKTCPHCGTSKPHKTNYKKVLIAGGIALVLFTIWGVSSNKNKVDSKTNLTQASSEGEKPIFTEKEAKIFSVLVNEDLYSLVDGGDSLIASKNIITPTPIVISSKKLQTEYEKNEVAADQKFKGKLVSVSGIVKSLDKTIGNNIQIGLNGGSNMFIYPRAEMAQGHEDWVANLDKGNDIGLVCTIKGMLIGAVYMDQCEPSHDWANKVGDNIISTTPELIKNNNELFVKLVDVSKEAASKLKADSKCFTNGTYDECMDEINKVLN